jgi:hypothetical protein
MRSWIMALLSFTVLAGAAPAGRTGAPQLPAVSTAPRNLGLETDDFWGDYRKQDKEIRAWILKGRFLGLLIGAPAIVDLSSRESLPLIGWYVRTLREDAGVDFDAQAVAVAVNLATNELTARPAFQSGKMPASSPALAAKDPGEGTAMTLVSADLRRALEIPWEPGKYSVTLVLRQRISNTVEVELQGAQPARKEPAKFVAKEVAPDYRKSSASPALPARTGIALSLTPSGKKQVLRGSYRLPVFSHESRETRENPAGAILGLWLVLIGAKTPGPFTIPLKLPVSEISGNAAPLASGYFNLDLIALPGFPRGPMEYYVYAFHGNVAAGPVTLPQR